LGAKTSHLVLVCNFWELPYKMT